MKRPSTRRRKRRPASLSGYLTGLAVLAAVLFVLRREASAPSAPHPAPSAATEQPAVPDAVPAPTTEQPAVPAAPDAAPRHPDASDDAEASARRTAATGRSAAGQPATAGSSADASAQEAPHSRAEAWPELPAPSDDADGALLYRTAWTTLDGRTVRNYTMCFDPSKRAARWVAYPLVAAYTGSQKRPDRWAYDPAIDREVQAALVDYSYPDRSFDRGHQIPNADRNRTSEMQMQTFYCSNSTPQNASLNGGGWAQLEERIRRSWICADTLYVVTGAVWESDRTTPDREGHACPVPDYYFKVLLRTRRGNIRRAGDCIGRLDPSQLKSIGFWVRNADGQGSFKEWTASVEQIERRTGLDLFPTVPAEVKRQHDKAAWGL